jgi:inner membrane protein
MMQSPTEQFSNSLRNSQTLRILSVGFLVLVLQIPIAMIGGLVSERQERRQAAVTEVSSKWGNAQSIVGPALVVPYTVRTVQTISKGRQVVHTDARNAVFLADTLVTHGTIDCETRHRGIFSVPVYRLKLNVEGEFARPSFAELGVQPFAVAWDKAHLAIGISDVRAIQEETVVLWNGRRVSFLPGTGAFVDAPAGIHAIVGVPAATQRIKFAFPLSLNGSMSAYLVPFAKSTMVELESNYRSPSFQGNWLPSERTIFANGFKATWSIPFLGRNYPQAWKADSSMHDAIDASHFGVDLVDPIDQYHMADRSVKYASLFLVLTFATIWLIEVLAGVRVHPIQYLLLGAALCLFYLLELSLSEQLGFTLAYSLACVSIIVMLVGYCVTVLLRVTRALLVGTGVAMLYAYLYILLQNEDYALLIGSIGLFAILAIVMFVTRRVDWYAGCVRPAAPAAVSPATGASDGTDGGG